MPVHNGSVLVMDPRNGEIYAMVGSRDYFGPEIQGENDNVLGLNSPGSSFKPFVYLESFLKLGWAPATAIAAAACSTTSVLSAGRSATLRPQKPSWSTASSRIPTPSV